MQGSSHLASCRLALGCGMQVWCGRILRFLFSLPLLVQMFRSWPWRQEEKNKCDPLCTNRWSSPLLCTLGSICWGLSIWETEKEYMLKAHDICVSGDLCSPRATQSFSLDIFSPNHLASTAQAPGDPLHLPYPIELNRRHCIWRSWKRWMRYCWSQTQMFLGHTSRLWAVQPNSKRRIN